MKETRVLLEIAYDGTDFAGWQRQPGQRTVQGLIEEKLRFLCNQEIVIEGTGRTDRGVHSLGQCASFSANLGIPVERMAYALNRLLPDSIFIKKAMEVPFSFHARFDAKKKTYRYKIIESKNVDPFLRNYYHFVSRPLNPEWIRQGLAHMEGTHDFASFQASGGKEMKSTVRRIFQTDLRCFSETPIKPGHLELSFTGDGFLYHMVRIMVGTLIEVGLGKRSPEEIASIIAQKDRRMAGPTAPPQGLYLEKVYFDEKGEAYG